MRTNTIRFGALVALAFLAASCMSPLDPTTPRNRIVDGGGTPETSPRKFQPDSLFIIFKLENEFRSSFVITDKEASLDTTDSPNALWLRASGTWAGNAPRGSRVVTSFAMRIDSSLIDGVRYPLSGDPQSGAGMMIVTGIVRDSTRATNMDTLYAHPMMGPTGMRFFYHKPGSEIWGDLSGSFGQPKIDVEAYFRLVIVH